MTKPVLSIGMIIKNEIRCLERCLKSLEPLRRAIPCELVIADTGSTDGSREVAERYADILFDFTWVNDFAAARNAVLERCGGKWFLAVDADEWLVGDFSELTHFLMGTEQEEHNAAFLVVRNFKDQMQKNWDDFYAGRLGKLRGGKLRYRNPIHEAFYYTDGTELGIFRKLNTVLNHDGYAYENEAQKAAKFGRNITLLREELKKDPTNLRTLVECVQSCIDRKELSGYVDQVQAVLRTPEGERNLFRAVGYQYSILAYNNQNRYEEVLSCLEEAEREMPGSYPILVDGEAAALVACHALGDYEGAAAHGRAWNKALADVDQGKDLTQPERYCTQYNTTGRADRSNLRSILADALRRLGRTEELEKVLEEIEPMMLSEQRAMQLLNSMLEGGCGSAFLARFWDNAMDLYREKGEDREKGKRLLGEATALFDSCFPLDAQVLERLGDRAPAQSARLLDTWDREWAAALAEQIEDWQWIFPKAIAHVMELGLALPGAFFRRPSEQITALAVRLMAGGGLRTARATAIWLTRTPPPATPMELLWALTLLESALQVEGWEKDSRLADCLMMWFQTLSVDYLCNIYNPELLNEEDIWTLPAGRRFSWYLWQADQLRQAGDRTGYVRALRSGLDAAPSMRRAVEYLLEHQPPLAPAPELQEMAQKVQALLAQYAPDDPAVTALKQSEAYQKVAHLLEGGEEEQKYPAVPPEEEPGQDLEDVFAVLERDCVFDSLEQARAAIQRSFDQVSPQNQAMLENYWTRYPLWGDSPTQVLDHIAEAFFRHWKEFSWMYSKLKDNRSRRTLLAVLRNWRYFDFDSLRDVIDNRFDDYFDLEILSCDQNDVVADIGAFVGDTFLSYVRNYGFDGYQRYYCYEITPDSFQKLQKTAAGYPNVICRQKGVGAARGEMFLSANTDSSANALDQSGEKRVEVAALDEDIDEPVTLIKMDIEGAEQSALKGCLRHIEEDQPKLALSVYHNFEDIWKLAKMVDETIPGYRFYLRYHGGNLWPSEISLLALPSKA